MKLCSQYRPFTGLHRNSWIDIPLWILPKKCSTHTQTLGNKQRKKEDSARFKKKKVIDLNKLKIWLRSISHSSYASLIIVWRSLNRSKTFFLWGLFGGESGGSAVKKGRNDYYIFYHMYYITSSLSSVQQTVYVTFKVRFLQQNIW